MRSLYQRLKELDPVTFERLCYHLLKEQYPTTDIRHVEGGGGDEGLDLFTGDLDVGPVVWQCKAFPNGIGQSQREQIRGSLRRVLATTRPKLWVLCTSVDLDAKAYRWWQRLQQSYQDQVQLGLVSASEIVHQLLFRRTIRETFFPEAIMDVAVLRSTLAGTNGVTNEELSALTADNAAQFLDRLSQRDPRFAYELTFRHDTGPTPTRNDALLTVTDDEKTIHVFSRDHETLKRDPPTVNFSLAGEGVTRFQDFLKTGKPADFVPGELTGVHSAFDFLLPPDADPVSTWRLTLSQNPGQLPTFAFRITIGEHDPVVYDLINLQTVRTGTKEAELRSTSKLPFELRLIIDFSGTMNVTWEDHTTGFPVREVHRAATALARMTNAEPVELHNLETGKRFLKLQPSTGPAPTWVRDFLRVAADAVAVSEHYGVNLQWPDMVTNQDLATLRRLKNLITGVPIPINTATVTINKIVQIPQHLVPEHLKGAPLRFAYPPHAAVALFSTTVPLGVLEVTIPHYRIMNKDAFAAFLKHAPIGTGFTIQITATHGGIATTPPVTA